jgi:hypothetical protein
MQRVSTCWKLSARAENRAVQFAQTDPLPPLNGNSPLLRPKNEGPTSRSAAAGDPPQQEVIRGRKEMPLTASKKLTGRIHPRQLNN